MSGGLNLRDGISLVNDNQLTDVKNMWYKDGILRTRPRIKENEAFSLYERHKNGSFSTNPMNNTRINDRGYYLELTHATNLVEDKETFYLKYVSLEDEVDLGSIDVSEPGATALAITHNGNVYVYVHGQTVNEIYIIKWISDGVYAPPHRADETEIYSPLVLTNVWSSYQQGGDAQALLRNGATQVEGFNLLGNRYRMQGSLYDASELGEVQVTGTDGEVIDTVSYMEYSVPFTPNNLSYDGVIRLQYTDMQGMVHTHSVYCPNINEQGNESRVESEESHISAGDGLYLHSFISGEIVHICLNGNSAKKSEENPSGNDPGIIKRSEYINNNMMIYAPCETSAKNWEKVTAMTQAVWYGNTSLGINGGSRLFLGGNTKDSEQALVIWSDFENPLYFSENNYAYVGDKSQRVTAFGRQGASLIIFKENEIYSTQYTQGEVTADELIDQTAVDISTRMAYFPMVLIHSTIGCDCPNTVQLCRNRLVFANSSGRVFTLTAQNQYSERNVYDVSEMISSKLKTEKEPQKAHSVDWDGKYILFVNKSVYLMDYNSYGYENIASYTKQSDANMLLPWWYWEMPTEVKNVTILNETIVLTDVKKWEEDAITEWFSVHKYYIDGIYGNDELFYSDFNGTSVTQTAYEKIIPTMLKTKIFDFGEHSKYKAINALDIAFGNNKNVPISVKFINGVNDTDEHIVAVNGAETTLKTPSHIISKRLIPYTRICARFGVCIECAGNMEIDGITIQYKKAGGIK